jgi:hypothetical protein
MLRMLPLALLPMRGPVRRPVRRPVREITYITIASCVLGFFFSSSSSGVYAKPNLVLHMHYTRTVLYYLSVEVHNVNSTGNVSDSARFEYGLLSLCEPLPLVKREPVRKRFATPKPLHSDGQHSSTNVQAFGSTEFVVCCPDVLELESLGVSRVAPYFTIHRIGYNACIPYSLR